MGQSKWKPFRAESDRRAVPCLPKNRWPRRPCQLRRALKNGRSPCRSAWANRTRLRVPLDLAEQITITLVGFSGGAKPGVLAHGPETAAVHRVVNATRVGKFARIPQGFAGIPARSDSSEYRRSMASPESVVNRVLRSGAALDLALRSDMRKPVPERIEEWPGKRMASQDYNWRERERN